MAMFDGKIAVVTGAARGIGQAIAVELAKQGATLALCDLDKEWLSETIGLIEGEGGKAVGWSVDVSNGDAVTATVASIIKEFGAVDILVNNAGITKDGLMLRMSESDWDAVMAVNLKGTFLFTKVCSRAMMKKRSGAIVNIASIIGLIGNAGQCNYAASKAGVIALTKSSAKELAARNVRVNAVAPGFIQSKMTDVLSEDVKNKMLGTIPMGRFGVPGDVANTVVFLASELSSYMTGQTLTVSGGMVM
jgi:3-oxoacyl-[acyl-carrier protein] reductase